MNVVSSTAKLRRLAMNYIFLFEVVAVQKKLVMNAQRL
jgi:hypothetical protein